MSADINMVLLLYSPSASGWRSCVDYGVEEWCKLVGTGDEYEDTDRISASSHRHANNAHNTHAHIHTRCFLVCERGGEV